MDSVPNAFDKKPMGRQDALLAGLLYDFLGLGCQHPKASRQCVNTTLDCCMTFNER